MSSQNGAMVYVHLLVALTVLLAVVTTYLPFRKDPFTGPAFITGWLVGELALQIAIALLLVMEFFEWVHAGRGFAGHLATGADLLSLVGLAGLFIAGLLARRVVHRELRDTPGFSLDVPALAGRAHWASWLRSLFAVPTPGRHVKVIKHVAYVDDGEKAHQLDVILPKQPVEGAPVMVFIHGGAWVIGDKREQGLPMLYELAARGWVCVSINYRLSPKATWPDHIVDVLRAIAWVKGNIASYGGDPSFVALSGGSAGGHLCALAGLAAGDPNFQPGFEDADTHVQACVPLYGVQDMTASREVGGRYGPGLRVLLERQVMKKTITEAPELFEQASPIHRLHPDAPPFLVLHGTHDTLVPVVVARTFVHLFRGIATAPVAYIELPLAQHAFDVFASPRSSATTQGIVAFLEAVRIEHSHTEIWRRATLEVAYEGHTEHPREIARREGKPVFLVTAYNPGGTAREQATNDAANEGLLAEITSLGLPHVAASGADPDSHWREPGWCVWGISREKAAALGARFGQLAVYEIEPERTSVVWCTSGRIALLERHASGSGQDS